MSEGQPRASTSPKTPTGGTLPSRAARHATAPAFVVLTRRWHSAKVRYRPNPPHRRRLGSWSAAPTVQACRRLRRGLWPAAQTAVAAGLSWYLASDVLGSPQPFFAPIAATVSLSASSVLRGQRALQLIGGVSLGIGIGVGFEHLIGTGSVALGAAVLVALAVALAVGGGFFGQGLMFVNQAGVSAILVITLHGGATGSERLVDALIGGGVAVVVSLLLFPTAPMPLVEEAVRSVLGALRDALAQLDQRLAARDRYEDRGWPLAASQQIHQQLAGLAAALASARDIVLLAPRRWSLRPAVRRAGECATRCDAMADSVLSLVRGADAAARAQDEEQGQAQEQDQEQEPGQDQEQGSGSWRAAVGKLTAAMGLLVQGAGAAEIAAERKETALPAGPAGTTSPSDWSEGGQADLVASAADACWQELVGLAEVMDACRAPRRPAGRQRGAERWSRPPGHRARRPRWTRPRRS